MPRGENAELTAAVPSRCHWRTPAPGVRMASRPRRAHPPGNTHADAILRVGRARYGKLLKERLFPIGSLYGRATIEFDAARIAAASGLSPESLIARKKDGRTSSLELEDHLENNVDGCTRAPHESDPWDIADPQGRLWELRCLTDNGLSFPPSKSKGVGRRFDPKEFSKRLKSLTGGFIVCDIRDYPRVDIFAFPSSEILELHRNGTLGGNAGTRSPRKARSLIEGIVKARKRDPRRRVAATTI